MTISGTTPTVGSSSQFTATVNFSNGTNQNVTSDATWQSSSQTIATVSSSGVVAGVSAGDADIRATYHTVTGLMHIAVAAESTFTMRGVVSQSRSSSPVQDVAVSVLDGVNAGRSTSTDANGFYNLGGMRGGTFTVHAVKPGYATTDRTVDLTADLRFDFTLTANTPPPPPAPANSGCDARLWTRVYNPSRLRVVDGCRTVTGTITDQHTNDDGDIDVRLEVDPPYKSLLSAGNISNLSGHLQTEAICQTAIRITDATRACRGFQGSVSIPPNGTHVQVTGPYVLDLTHGWMEIHPISVLSVIR